MKNNNVFYNNIAVDRIDMIDKLSYLYWYEHFSKDGWVDDKHKSLYQKTKSEVMEYGYGYYLDKEKE